ncbi:MAG: DUF4126 domain-containing protein [Vulcanimicrobiota bacterium]
MLALVVLMQVAMGVSLAACAGLRAFLPLFVISILARTGYLHLHQGFEWMGSIPALITFGTATLIEILGDKIPAVDNLLDSAGIVVKPVAGAVLVSSVVVKMDPLLAIVLGIIAGGSIAGIIHSGKAGVRVASTGLTLGIANPIVSVAEDLGVISGVALAVIAPIAALTVIVLVSILVRAFIRKKTAGESSPQL